MNRFHIVFITKWNGMGVLLASGDMTQAGGMIPDKGQKIDYGITPRVLVAEVEDVYRRYEPNGDLTVTVYLK